MKIINQLHTSIKITDQNTFYIVGSDLLDNLSKLDVFKSLAPDKFLLLTDQKVFDLYGNRVLESLDKTGRKVITSVVPVGEKSKTLKLASSVCKTFLEGKISRKSILFTLGGGVVTDLGGFIGAILLRGITVIHLPTTLLSQIDAAIGGKSGVDLWVKDKMIKNMIGEIEQPYAVVSDVALLSTLPEKEILNGLGEMVKYWVGWGRPTRDQISKIKDQKDNILQAHVIFECQQIKLDVIQKDPFDRLGLREKLNLGHTIAHAIEGASCGRLSHGESVSLGIVCAAKISVALKLMQPKIEEFIKSTIRDLGLATQTRGLNIREVTRLISYDKKGGTFVLIKDIGRLTSGIKVELNLVKKVLSEVIL